MEIQMNGAEEGLGLVEKKNMLRRTNTATNNIFVDVLFAIDLRHFKNF